MAIPAEIKEVIRLASIQSEEETKLQSLRDKKQLLLAQLDDVNTSIDLQQPIVQQARINLKKAAALI